MTLQQQEIIRKLREYAERPENYNKGWDIIVEATTDEELLEMFGATDPVVHTELEALFGTELHRMPEAATYKEAKRRVKAIVELHEERRQEAINEIF